MNSRTRVNVDWWLIGDDQPIKDCVLTMFLNQRKDILTEFETGRIISVGTCMILWIEIEISNPKLFKCNACAVKFATKDSRIHILQMFMKVENHSNMAFVMLANVLWINIKHISQFTRKKKYYDAILVVLNSQQNNPWICILQLFMMEEQIWT